MFRKILYSALLVAILLLVGCSETEEEAQMRYVNELIQDQSSLDIELPVFEDYTIVAVSRENETSPYLSATYAYDELVTERMEQSIQRQVEENTPPDENTTHIFGPHFSTDDTIFHIYLHVVDSLSEGSYLLENADITHRDVNGTTATYQLRPSDTSDLQYLMLLLENDGVYYHVARTIFTDLSEDEVDDLVEEMIEEMF